MPDDDRAALRPEVVNLLKAAASFWARGKVRHAEGMARAAWRKHAKELQR